MRAKFHTRGSSYPAGNRALTQLQYRSQLPQVEYSKEFHTAFRDATEALRHHSHVTSITSCTSNNRKVVLTFYLIAFSNALLTFHSANPVLSYVSSTNLAVQLTDNTL